MNQRFCRYAHVVTPLVRTTTAGIVALGLAATPALAATIVVPDDETTIQEAIDAASPGDEIMVEDGTYIGPLNRNLDFGGKDLYLRSENGPDDCIIDCQGMGRAFLFAGTETPAAIVEGFTIQNGSVEDAGGGAISVSGGSSPTIRQCVFLDNTAFSGAGAFPVGSGGAIHSAGGVPTIEDCVFTGNVAGFAGAAPGTGFGGAIFLFLGGGSVTGCTFNENAADGPGVFGNGIGGGIAVFFTAPGTPAIDGCDFNGNTAVIAGGGVWVQGAAPSITGGTFDGNTAQSGGGIALFEGGATISGASFINNSVASDEAVVQQQIGGGAIGCADTVTATISDCFFSGNSSQDGVGGAVTSVGGSVVTVENCEFQENVAATHGGAAHVGGAAPGADADDLPFPPNPDMLLPSTLTMTGCTMTCNTALSGGGVSNRDGSTLSMTGCDLDANTAFTDSGGFPDGSGGGLWAVGGASTLTGCSFTGNTAGFAGSAPGTGFGGGMYFFLGGGSVTDCSFEGNLADGPGGFGNGIGGGVAVFFTTPDGLAFDGCEFDGNTAVIAGGGMWIQGTSSSISNSTFDENTAQSGGGLAVFEAAATVTGSDFTDNSVASDEPVVQQQIGGGAIGAADTAVLTVRDCSFIGNTSEDGVGGGVSSIGSSTATIINSEFRRNASALSGGGVHNGVAGGSGDPDLEGASTMTLINCLLSCNETGGFGGGVDNEEDCTLSMVNCTVAHNDASAGGGLANLGAAADATNCIFYGSRADNSASGRDILDVSGTAIVSFSLVKGGWPGAGNTHKNPKWVDAKRNQCDEDTNDYRLRENSRAINAGFNDVVTEPTDIDGNMRIIDVIVDMGAYEFVTLMDGGDDDDDDDDDDGANTPINGFGGSNPFGVGH